MAGKMLSAFGQSHCHFYWWDAITAEPLRRALGLLLPECQPAVDELRDALLSLRLVDTYKLAGGNSQVFGYLHRLNDTLVVQSVRNEAVGHGHWTGWLDIDRAIASLTQATHFGRAILLECEMELVDVSEATVRARLERAIRRSPDYRGHRIGGRSRLPCGWLFDIGTTWILVHDSASQSEYCQFLMQHWLRLMWFLNRHGWHSRLLEKVLRAHSDHVSGEVGPGQSEGADGELIRENIDACTRGFESCLKQIGLSLTSSDNNSAADFLLQINQQLRFATSAAEQRLLVFRTSRDACSSPVDGREYRGPGSRQPDTRFHSCFISYSQTDRAFAEALEARLRRFGVSCWLAEKQMLPGDKLYDRVDAALRRCEKVILCCSRNSMASWWVDIEIEAAFQKEQDLVKQGRNGSVLIPLDLDGYLTGSTSISAKARVVRSRLAADFTGWESDPAKFEYQTGRVVEALRADRPG